MNKYIDLAIKKLGVDFNSLDLTFHKMETNIQNDITSYWPGEETEDILVCVFKGKQIQEPFHRQDFFFINYAYKNSYQALSEKYNNLITINENECYIGQPYSGYALRANDPEEVIIIGILIRKETFFKEYLPTIYTSSSLFHFFVEPKINKFSDEYIHLSLQKEHPIRTLLELMALEYANKKNDTQAVLKSLLQTLLLEIARRYKIEDVKSKQGLIEEIVSYIEEHSDNVTLNDVASNFSYHPNYISSFIHKETGKNFKDILLESRMKRADLLLKNTSLSIEEISSLIGYSDHSNFYKAFKEYYKITPREYIKKY